MNGTAEHDFIIFTVAMTRNLRAHLSLLAVSLIFGLNYTITKEILAVLSPMQLIFLRLLGGMVLFWLFQRLFVPEKVDRRDLLILAVCGIVGFALNQALFFLGLNQTTPVDASVIHVLSPILVLIFAHIIIHEKVTWRKAGGILLGATGALTMILYGRMGSAGENPVAGNIMILLNMVFYALYLVLIKPMVAKYHTTTILKWVSFFGFLFIFPFSVGPATRISFTSLSPLAWAGLAYIIFMNTFLAYMLINYALKQVMPSMVSIYSYLQPVVAAVTSLSLGNEILTFPKILAALLIFAGVYVVNSRNEMSKQE